MIYDRIDRLAVWAERCPALRDALLAAAAQDAAPFTPGKIRIDGETLYASSTRYTTEAREERRFENHRRYLDIQMLVSGEEQIDVCLSYTPLPDGEYRGAEDIEFSLLEENYVTIPLRPGEFLVLFPGEWHRPCLNPSAHREICEKIVIKADITAKGKEITP